MNKLFVVFGVGLGLVLGTVLVLNSTQALARTAQADRNSCKSSTVSTSTYTLLTTGDTASSTLSCEVSSAESVSFDFCAYASSSSAYLNPTFYFSNDDGTNDSAKSWFQELSSVQDSSTRVSHGFIDHSVSLATTTANWRCGNVLLNSIDHKYLKVDLGVYGANAGLWYALTPKISL